MQREHTEVKLDLSWTARDEEGKGQTSDLLCLEIDSEKPAQEIGQEGEDQKGKMEPKSEDHSTCTKDTNKLLNMGAISARILGHNDLHRAGSQ